MTDCYQQAMPSDMPLFNLRLPQELLDRVKVHAVRNRRSATSIIVEFIEDGLARNEPQQSPENDAANERFEKSLSKMPLEQKERMLDALQMLQKIMSDATEQKKKSPTKK